MPIRDTRMMARAVTQRWPISDKVRKAIVGRLVQVVADPESSPREVTAAAKALISAESQNQADEHKVIDIGNQHNRDRIADVIARLGINPALVFDGQSNEAIDVESDGGGTFEGTID
jgi:hypothetical protein